MALQRRLLGVAKERASIDPGFELNRDSPQERGLVGFFPFIIGAGTSIRNLGSVGGSGTITGSTWFWDTQLEGSVVNFGGSGGTQVCTLPALGLSGSNPCSFSFKVRPNPGANGLQSMVGWGSSGTRLQRVAHWDLSANENLYLAHNSGDLYTAANTVPNGQISHVVITYGPAGASISGGTKIYINNVLQSVTTVGSVVDTPNIGNANYQVGNDFGANRSFNGAIWDVSFWNYELPTGLVSEVFRNPFGLYKTPINRFYSFPSTTAVTGGGSSGRTRYTFLDPVPDEEDPEFVRKLQFTVGQSRGALDRRAAFARHALKIISGGK